MWHFGVESWNKSIFSNCHKMAHHVTVAAVANSFSVLNVSCDDDDDVVVVVVLVSEVANSSKSVLVCIHS